MASRLLTSPPGLLASKSLTVSHLPRGADTILSTKRRISYAPISTRAYVSSPQDKGTNAPDRVRAAPAYPRVTRRAGASQPGRHCRQGPPRAGRRRPSLGITQTCPIGSSEIKLTAKALCCIAESRKPFLSVPVRHHGKYRLLPGIPRRAGAAVG